MFISPFLVIFAMTDPNDIKNFANGMKNSEAIGFWNVKQITYETEVSKMADDETKVKKISTDNRFEANQKRIDELSSKIFNETGSRITKGSNEVIKQYKAIEREALCADKGMIGRTYTVMKLYLGMDSLPKTLERENKTIDRIVSQYEELENRVQGDIDKLNSQYVEHIKEKNQICYLGETLEENVLLANDKIAENDEKIGELMKTPGYDREKEQKLGKLTAKKLGLETRIKNYARKTVDGAHKLKEVNAKIEMLDEQTQRLEDDLDGIQYQKNQEMAKKTPTTYLIQGLKHAEQIERIGYSVERSGTRFKYLAPAAQLIKQKSDDERKKRLKRIQKGSDVGRDILGPSYQSDPDLAQERQDVISQFSKDRKAYLNGQQTAKQA